MAEFENIAYQDIRQSMVENWDELRLYNTIGNLVYSKEVLTSGKAKWAHTVSRVQVVIGTDINGSPITAYKNVQDNPNMLLQVSILGSDVVLPCTIASFELVNTKSHDKSARVKEMLTAVAPLTLRTDTFLYNIKFKVGV